MNEITAVVTGPEEAYDIDARFDGSPWLVDVARMTSALADAEQRLAAY